MYISFIVIGDYSLITYSFHKLECAALFGAFSITIHDWTTVLYAIHEDTQFESRLKSLLLIGINLLFMIISVVNFSYCYAVENFDAYTNSPVYIVALFIQIFPPLILAIVMLRAGLKLSWRIKGASGALVKGFITDIMH